MNVNFIVKKKGINCVSTMIKIYFLEFTQLCNFTISILCFYFIFKILCLITMLDGTKVYAFKDHNMQINYKYSTT